jgi:hypothetical protein
VSEYVLYEVLAESEAGEMPDLQAGSKNVREGSGGVDKHKLVK